MSKADARWKVISDRRHQVEGRIRAREFVFGIQDGLISTVGLLSGVWAATQDLSFVLITGAAATVTGGLAMATGSYLAAKTEKEIFEREFLDQERLAREQPYLAREALLESLIDDGLDRESAYRVVQNLAQREDLLLRTVQEKVLGLGSADISQPFKAGTVMFLSFLIGSVVPIFPYLFVPGGIALFISWAASVGTLYAVGVFKGYLVHKSKWRSGLEFAIVALGAALIGWLLGQAIQLLV